MKIKLEFDLSKTWEDMKRTFDKINIGHLLLLSLALHLFAMPFPSDGGMIFDEAHYVPAAMATLRLEPANVEHTPLAKILIAISIGILGNYWFAWRFPIIIMGVLALYVFYRIAQFFLEEKTALIATAFLSFDIIFFVHSSIFVLDTPAILFGLLGIERYLNGKHKSAAASFGISFLMKETGLFFLGATGIYHFLQGLKTRRLDMVKEDRRVRKKKALVQFLMFMLVLVIVGGGGLWIYDIIYKPTAGTTVQAIAQPVVYVDGNGNPTNTTTIVSRHTLKSLITNPVDHMLFSWIYFSNLAPAVVTSEENFRPPWSWILPIGDIFNAPKYLIVSVRAGDLTWCTIRWISQITPSVEFFLIPILVAFAVNGIRKRRVDEKGLGLLVCAWILTSYMPFLMIGLFVQRMTFNYYFIYTIPALALGIPYFWQSISFSDKVRMGLLLIQLFVTIEFFLGFFPVVIFR